MNFKQDKLVQRNCIFCRLIMMDRSSKKGNGLHLDIVLLSLINFLGSIFGGPWICAATVRAVSHVSALTVMSTTHAPGEAPHIVEVKGTLTWSGNTFEFPAGVLRDLNLFFPLLQINVYPPLSSRPSSVSPCSSRPSCRRCRSQCSSESSSTWGCRP